MHPSFLHGVESWLPYSSKTIMTRPRRALKHGAFGQEGFCQCRFSAPRRTHDHCTARSMNHLDRLTFIPAPPMIINPARFIPPIYTNQSNSREKKIRARSDSTDDLEICSLLLYRLSYIVARLHNDRCLLLFLPFKNIKA